MTAAMPEMEAASCEHREILGVERVLDQSSRSEFSKGRKPLPCAPLAAVRILQTYAERGVPLAPRAAGTSLRSGNWSGRDRGCLVARRDSGLLSSAEWWDTWGGLADRQPL